MLKNLAALGCGMLFSLGLVIAQMVNPQKVLAFLDVAGQWDPSLALVMVGALVTLGALQRFIIFRRRAPLLAPKFQLPEDKAIDRRLIVWRGAIWTWLGDAWFLSGACICSIDFPTLANVTVFNCDVYRYTAL